MDLLAAFGVFLACVAGCMVKGASLGWALAAGFVCFFAVTGTNLGDLTTT